MIVMLLLLLDIDSITVCMCCIFVCMYLSRVCSFLDILCQSECTDGRLFTKLLTVWKFSPGLPGNSSSCTVDFLVLTSLFLQCSSVCLLI